MTRTARPRSGSPGLEKRLAAVNAATLRALLVDVAASVPEAARWLSDALDANERSGGGHGDARNRRLVATLADDIDALDRYIGIEGSTAGEPFASELDAIEHRLAALAERGEHDAVVGLGEALWTKASALVECSDEDSDGVIHALQDCFGVVTGSLSGSSLAPAAQLLWVIERQVGEEYPVLDEADALLEKTGHGEDCWRTVAAELERRLAATPVPASGDYLASYRRSRLFREWTGALAKAGLSDRVIPAMEVEVDATDQYVALVDALLAAGETARARRWCIVGHGRTIERAAGTAARLRDRLRELALSEGDHALVAAYRAQGLVERPGLERWRELEAAAGRAGCWAAVRRAMLHHLDTGELPAPGPAAMGTDGTRATSKSGREAARADTDWPLPPPEVDVPPAKGYRPGFPARTALIEIALYERRFDDALDHFARLDPRWPGLLGLGRDVAAAVAASRPEAALGIWRAEVERLIAEVKPRAYERAGTILVRMRETLEVENREADWTALIEQLRASHKAKRRLMEVLDDVAGERGDVRRR